MLDPINCKITCYILRTYFAVLLVFCYGNLFGQPAPDTTRLSRFEKYQQMVTIFRALKNEMAELGLDIFQPDLSQPGGGQAFKTAIALRSAIKTESIKLGLKQQLDEGWYKAVVYYDNSNTFTQSRYILDTKVEGNRVVVIYFPSGGFLHTGQNNSGYDYYGGELELDHYFSGEIMRATTHVRIVTKSSKTTYTIIIE